MTMAADLGPSDPLDQSLVALETIRSAVVNLGRIIVRSTDCGPTLCRMLQAPAPRAIAINELLWWTYEQVFRAHAERAGMAPARLEAVNWWVEADEPSIIRDPALWHPLARDLFAGTTGPTSLPNLRRGFFAYASAYQSLLAETDQIADLILDSGSPPGARVSDARRDRGVFYTPQPLIEHLLRSSVCEPLQERLKQIDPASTREQVILSFRVCDPAAGVGGFLRLASRFLASQFGADFSARVLNNCIYGVDIDPLAITLCRAVLMLEAPNGCQWSSLCQHIKVGHAIIGATPSLIAAGIPSEAFRGGPGDLPAAQRYYRDRNRRERRTMRTDLVPVDPKLAADAWCAAFVWRLTDTDQPGMIEGCPGRWDAITQRTFEQIQQHPHTMPTWMIDEIHRLAREHRFFHWHLEFPEVIKPNSTLFDGSDSDEPRP